jgi:hypothetical protein
MQKLAAMHGVSYSLFSPVNYGSPELDCENSSAVQIKHFPVPVSKALGFARPLTETVQTMQEAPDEQSK